MSERARSLSGGTSSSLATTGKRRGTHGSSLGGEWITHAELANSGLRIDWLATHRPSQVSLPPVAPLLESTISAPTFLPPFLFVSLQLSLPLRGVAEHTHRAQ